MGYLHLEHAVLLEAAFTKTHKRDGKWDFVDSEVWHESFRHAFCAFACYWRAREVLK